MFPVVLVGELSTQRGERCSAVTIHGQSWEEASSSSAAPAEETRSGIWRTRRPNPSRTKVNDLPRSGFFMECHSMDFHTSWSGARVLYDQEVHCAKGKNSPKDID
ncbi:hypothetical protein JTE90_018846 [Oedothorax gibbosus]|uniref:Uncharacterized protein n=1 Tax=Oedothorax gibbosus TaxID=931172 RepID=A0AAV6UVC7_9ARAC|nr:hypothetical protein JTE90_018846 [Oedothorax gibbosus]